MAVKDLLCEGNLLMIVHHSNEYLNSIIFVENKINAIMVASKFQSTDK
jgi:hypothetical protein